MPIVSSYGMLRRRKIFLIVISAILFVISTSFMMVASFIMAEAGGGIDPLFGDQFLEATYPLLFFIPSVVTNAVLGLTVVLSITALLTMAGASSHRKRVLFASLFLMFFLICIEIVFFILLSLDLFEVVTERDVSSFNQLTHIISAKNSEAVINEANKNPEKWRKVQDNFKCCGYDFVTLYYGDDREEPVNNMVPIHTGSHCVNDTDTKIALILSAFPAFSETSMRQFNALVGIKYPSYLCKGKVITANYYFYYYGAAIVFVVLALQILSFWYSRTLVKSKKFKSFRLSSLQSKRSTGNLTAARQSALEKEKLRQNSELFHFSPSVDPVNQHRYSNLSLGHHSHRRNDSAFSQSSKHQRNTSNASHVRGLSNSHLTTLGEVEIKEDDLPTSLDSAEPDPGALPSMPSLLAPKVSNMAAASSDSQSTTKKVVFNPPTSGGDYATGSSSSTAARESTMSSMSNTSKPNPKSSSFHNFGLQDQLDADDLKILYGGFGAERRRHSDDS